VQAHHSTVSTHHHTNAVDRIEVSRLGTFRPRAAKKMRNTVAVVFVNRVQPASAVA
jgi:hypothetical protein